MDENVRGSHRLSNFGLNLAYAVLVSHGLSDHSLRPSLTDDVLIEFGN